MNKYQEALDNLIRVSCPRKVSCKECDFEKLCNSQAKGYIDTIQELVDRATPKKITKKHVGYLKDNDGNKHDIYLDYCPNCNVIIEEFIDKGYCYNCGQALYWYESEEKE